MQSVTAHWCAERASLGEKAEVSDLELLKKATFQNTTSTIIGLHKAIT